LPRDTIFPGPWEQNIRAPLNKSHITPVKIYNFEGATVGAEAVLQDANVQSGLSWVISPGGLITFEFGENIAGKVCFEIDDVKNHPYLVLAYSESPFFAGRQCDATGDQLAQDIPLRYDITHKGMNCVGGGYNRGAFKYLTVFMPENDLPTEGGYWHDETSIHKRSADIQKLLQNKDDQEIIGGPKNETGESAVVISALWVNCTAFPSMRNGRAYTGYFDSSSSMLNRVWYAGAWTLQLSTLDPREGGSIIDFNRFFDHNNAPRGAWYSNYTIANGTTVTTDGAKRDRMVWPGDMTIAVPGIAVTTYDMLAVRNALNTIYDHQYGDGSMPYAGPPMGAFGEFSDTYHLHTLVGTYYYVLYSGDLDWLKSRWNAYLVALAISVNKVDETGLLHVSSVNDWIRPGMTGHNVEASSILYEVLGNSIKLAKWMGKNETKINGEEWRATQSRLRKGIATLYCDQDGLYSDNMGRRGCNGPEKVLPQDGNSWALMSEAFTDKDQAYNVSENLRKRWIKYGAPAVEFPNVISPFASSFELLGHAAAGNHDAAVELIELMWGYMLDGPGMTNSTLIEGYRTDGYVQYPAYWSAARNSHAHGWAAGPTTVLTQGILGITLLTPMGKTWEIEPHLTKWLSYAQGGFATKLGKFEVSVTTMRSLSTGRKVEALNVTYPSGTMGLVKWGGKAQFRTEGMGTSFSYYRYIDATTLAEQEWQTWSVDGVKDFVKDDTWRKPEVEERLDGVVDWEALEKNY
ncbi:Six-hairpin glycosidase, partial [Mollisia scopiformis]